MLHSLFINAAQCTPSFVPSFTKISQRVLGLLSGHISLLKFLKGHNSVKNVGGAMVLNLCILSHGALYLYQVSRKYLEGFMSY